jgi:hypothetical protein
MQRLFPGVAKEKFELPQLEYTLMQNSIALFLIVTATCIDPAAALFDQAFSGRNFSISMGAFA